MSYLSKLQDLNNTKVYYFGVNGEEFDTDVPNVLAKKVVGAKRERYYIKYNTAGVEAGHIVNPWSMYADEYVKYVAKENPQTGRPYQEYKEVTEIVFNLYLSYLKSRSDLHYRQAERMSIEYAL